MKICIAYDTYSNSTESVVGFVESQLKEMGHEVIVKRMRDLQNPQEIEGKELTIIASPSWFEREQEGQPHYIFLKYMDAMQSESFKDKKFALIGLGDSTYARFCNGIEEIKKFIEDREGILVIPTLKLDSFYFNQDKQTALLIAWVQQLPLH